MPLYYRITPINELGEGTPVEGSYDPEPPDAGTITEGGGQTLTFGAISDGQLLIRSGTQIVGVDPDTVGGSLSFTAPTFGTGWSNWGSTFANAGYAKTAEGLVILRGTVKGGAQASTIFTLPAGFRPAADLIISTQNGGSFGYVIVHADGTVTADTYTNTAWTLSLDSVRFVAEQ